MLRVVSWNVRSLRDDARAVARLLHDLRPDLVVLQEAPRLALWRSSRALLARRAGLRPAGSARAAGNQLLVAPHVQVLAARAVLLPRRPGLHRRAVALAQVRVTGRTLTLAGTHLDLAADARLDSAQRVRALLGGGPMVLGADVNEEPGGSAWQALADGLRGGSPGPSFPAHRPRRRIDAVLTTLQVEALRVVDTGEASDHLAVVADLR